jgi:hypothetical protein
VRRKEKEQWRKKRPSIPYIGPDEESIKRYFRKKMASAAMPEKKDKPAMPLLLDLDELPAALQVSAFKGLKREYGFTNQVDEFFPVDEVITRDIRRKLEREKRKVLSQ